MIPAGGGSAIRWLRGLVPGAAAPGKYPVNNKQKANHSKIWQVLELETGASNFRLISYRFWDTDV